MLMHAHASQSCEEIDLSSSHWSRDSRAVRLTVYTAPSPSQLYMQPVILYVSSSDTASLHLQLAQRLRTTIPRFTRKARRVSWAAPIADSERMHSSRRRTLKTLTSGKDGS